MTIAPAQLIAELNAATMSHEERYTEVHSVVYKALQKAMSIKTAIASYEMKIQKATAEFNQELAVIEENFSK